MGFILDQIVYILIYIVPVIVGWESGKWLAGKIRMPYRWKCRQCGFKVRTNNRETFEISKSSHNHISTREYK